MTTISRSATKEAPTSEKQSLVQILDTTFSVRDPAEFANRLAGLTAALLNARAVIVVAKDDETLPLLAQAGQPSQPEALHLAIQTVISEGAPTPILEKGVLVFEAALPTGRNAVLSVEIPSGNPALQSLAYERVTLLQKVAKTQFRHEELTGLTNMLSAAQTLTVSSDPDLQSFVDQLAQFCSADHVAIARFDGAKAEKPTISGQNTAATRAILPDQLRGSLSDTVRTRATSATRLLMALPSAQSGYVLDVAKPTRNQAFIPLIVSAALQSGSMTKPRRNWAKTFTRLAVTALVLVGVAAIPLPEGSNITATVRAENYRVVTSPITAPLSEVLATENQIVEAGQTVLVRLDTTDLDNELVRAQADYSAALLARETARAGRQAAELRNAELEAERIAARVNLIESQRADAVIVAPISGRATLGDIKSLQGSVIRQGDTLIEIADPSDLELQLDISQRDLGFLADGDAGVFRPDYDPSLEFEAEIASISPAARDSDPNPIYLGVADLEGDIAQLRHGMSGVLRISREWRPAGLIFWDAVQDWIRLRLWL